MGFTEAEKEAWHKARRRARDDGYEADMIDTRETSMPICLHCHNPFPASGGVVTSDAAICDACNG